MRTYKKENNKRKMEKSKTRKHGERKVAGEILALDPNHKPRGGYKRLMQAVMEDYNNEDDLY